MTMHLHETRCICILMSRLMQVHENAMIPEETSSMSRKPSAETTSAWARLMRVQHGLLAAVEQDLKKAGFPSLVWYDALLEDRKSTRLNSSHGYISYAVFCLKKK